MNSPQDPTTGPEDATSVLKIANYAVTLALAKLAYKDFSWIKAANVFLAIRQDSIGK